MIRHTVLRSDPDHYLVEIPLRREQIQSVINVLNLIGVPAVRPPGGPGWLLEEGCISIAGNQTAVEKALAEISRKLIGPGFETGLDVANRHKQGALL
ncbi:hypothetical protein ACKUB1_13690 [Methanospirillum stamsii]|uniref:Uncharacterized protein n=1 Tax=Methanospirillum stamsii TaxID=1277351 RepID=A0A2V2N845_9EURY|nr:hypothetical protein [Methanospirillum stamsii]PWR74840.1 hypothetical protein DLD82_08050 [Methanospirillum stamsii]